MKKSETKTVTNNGSAIAANAAAEAASSSVDPTKEELEAEFDPNDKGKWNWIEGIQSVKQDFQWTVVLVYKQQTFT